jgi:hypothetical protein
MRKKKTGSRKGAKAQRKNAKRLDAACSWRASSLRLCAKFFPDTEYSLEVQTVPLPKLNLFFNLR